MSDFDITDPAPPKSKAATLIPAKPVAAKPVAAKPIPAMPAKAKTKPVVDRDEDEAPRRSHKKSKVVEDDDDDIDDEAPRARGKKPAKGKVNPLIFVGAGGVAFFAVAFLGAMIWYFALRDNKPSTAGTAPNKTSLPSFSQAPESGPTSRPTKPGAVPEPEPRKPVEPRPTAGVLPPVDPQTCAAFQAMDAERGVMMFDSWTFRNERTFKPLEKEYPGFAFSKPPAAKLPDVDVIFALDLKQARPKVGDTDLKHLIGAKTLVALNLEDTPITGKGLKELKGLQNLQRLNLSGTKVTDADLVELAGLTKLATLELNIRELGDPGAKILGSIKSLKQLNLNSTRLTDAGVKSLSELENLESLDLGNTGATDAGAVSLAKMTKLKRLSLNGTKITHKGILELKDLPELQYIHIYPDHKTDVAIRALHDAGLLYAVFNEVSYDGSGYVNSRQKILKLHMQNTLVTDAALKTLKELTSLELLQLTSTKVTDRGMPDLAGLTSLKDLNLADTKVTDAGVASLKALKSLEELNLYETALTDACIPTLAGLTNLKKLNLSGTKISNAGLLKLKVALPKCMITKN